MNNALINVSNSEKDFLCTYVSQVNKKITHVNRLFVCGLNDDSCPIKGTSFAFGRKFVPSTCRNFVRRSSCFSCTFGPKESTKGRGETFSWVRGFFDSVGTGARKSRQKLECDSLLGATCTSTQVHVVRCARSICDQHATTAQQHAVNTRKLPKLYQSAVFV